MKRFAIPAISLAALMASGVAFAETTTGQQPQQPAQEVQQKKQDPAIQAPVTPDPSQTGQSAQPKTDENTAQQPTTSTDPKMAVTWESQYQTLLSSAQTEEARKKFLVGDTTPQPATPKG